MKNILRKLIMLFIFSCVFLCSYQTKVSAEEISYIYFDLNAGSVTINNSSYTGYVFETIDGITSKKTITGTHSDSNKYYVYQSTEVNKGMTGYVNGEFILPEYSEVMVEGKTWSDYVTNNTDILGIIDNWNSATLDERTATNNQILVSATKAICDLTIDNIWSSFQSAGSSLSGGGISVSEVEKIGTHVTIRIKGDNRLGSVRYYSAKPVTNDLSKYNSLTFTSASGDASAEGSLTVIGDQALTRSNGNYTTVKGEEGKNGNVTKNHWDSVIGGIDSYDAVYGLYIKGATIYAGATARENCTAIGGGGNGMGNVMISGGNVTAVSSTTGTAIGGGIAHTATGGTSDVVISGGEVYAYNFGQPARDVISNYGSGVSQEIKDAASHIAGTAIGGASSILSAGNSDVAKVTITGGKVYAESLGGCGIGAGNSVNTTAGSANVTITGGEVTANSKGGIMHFSKGEPFEIKPGVSIGGGSGGINGNGGSATINISGGIIKTGSIGGGSTRNTNGKIGYADIKITGGDISGQFIMVKGGTSACKFNMTGGKIHDSNTTDNEFVKLQENGGAVYMDDPNGVATISGGTIENCSALNGGAVYMTAGQFTLSGTGEIKDCNASELGGAVYLGKTGDVKGTFTMSGGSISNNKALNGNGGAFYLDGGDATINGGTVDLNKAINGGGAYLAGGALQISDGIFKDNKVTANGGGAYVSGGNITMTGGSFENNTAEDSGGGIYITGGSLSMSGGIFKNNKAVNDGGGAYVSGGDALITGTGSIANNTAGLNGGGVYVANGNVTMIGGTIDNNTATNGDGGGIYVSANGNDVQVQILSGSVTNNKSSKNGGAVSVVGIISGTETITVTIGVDENHFDSDGNFISCNHGNDTNKSTTCPIIEGNEASGKGGAVYITGGKQTYLNIYCLIENDNASLSDKERSNFMMVEGGTVVISTCKKDIYTPAVYGNSVIKDSLHVVAGSLDIYGSMDNPKFDDSITVNITKQEDHFGDHRTQTTSGIKYYKVQYFENFEDPTTGVVTGEYSVYQYKEGETIEISGVVFSHPGYEIIGWFTGSDGSGDKYEVGQKVKFGTDCGDLKIYAIWTAHSYYVEFIPNIPDGITFEGNMPKVQYTYNTEYTLPLNTFVYPGYIFTGWKGSDGKSYTDGQKVSNLTGVDGATITLTAQWVTCDHDINNTEYNIFYVYTANGKILSKTCNCKGYNETVTINVNNYTYDGLEHRASLIYSGNQWLETLTIIYLRNGIEVTNPVNAGNYEVRVSYNSVTASATFIIYKADQDAPNKPSFTPEQVGDNWKIVVTPSPEDNSLGKVYEYRLSYYAAGVIKDLDWQDNNAFSLPIAFTNYIIYIRYAGDENHNPSEKVRADQMYYYSPEVSIIIDCSEGFFCTLEKNTISGLNINVTVLDGYYKTSDFIVTAETRLVGNTELSDKQAQVKNNYTLLDEIPSDNNYIITLIVRGARKTTLVSSYITADKVFTDVNTFDATIAKDSAFTTYFNISYYDKYEDLRIKFNEILPIGTSIILIDKSNNTYWYFNFNTSNDTLLINDFIKMGETTKFNVSGTTLKYQFIVDFSKVEEALTADCLSVWLYADPDPTEKTVPDFSTGKRTVNLVSVLFEINDKTQDDNTSEKLFETKFAATTAQTSKWDNKAATLVVTPNEVLPSDSRIKITQGNKTTYYYQNELDKFIIPLKGLSLETFNLSLESSLFPEEGKSYNLNIKLYASNSSVGTAVLNGKVVAEITTLTFEAKAISCAAIKITGQEHIVKVGEELIVNLAYVLPEGCTISSDLMVKAESGEYTSSGKRPEINSQGNLTISLAGLVEGSYYFRVIIKDSAGITVLSVPYYFIITSNGLQSFK